MKTIYVAKALVVYTLEDGGIYQHAFRTKEEARAFTDTEIRDHKCFLFVFDKETNITAHDFT